MAISRLHLAAALLEYDNDTDSPDPYQTKRSHRDSALFQPFQPRPLDQPPSRPTSYISQQPQSRPQSSYFPTQTPNQPLAQEPEEDVSKWGIPTHLLSPDTNTRPPPLRTISMITPQPEPMHQRAMSVHIDVLSGSQSEPHHPEEGDQRPKSRGSISGMIDDFGVEDALARAERVRRMVEGDMMGHGEEVLNPIMVPLPTSPSSTHTITPRPISSMSYNQSYSTNRPQSTTPYNRPLSSISYNRPASSLSYNPVQSHEGEEVMDDTEPNPFALPAPPVELGSRFDPKVLAAQRRDSFDGLSGGRRQSIGSILGHDGVQRGLSERPGTRVSVYRNDSRELPPDTYDARRTSTITTHHDPRTSTTLPSQSPLPKFLTSPSKSYPTLPTPKEYGKPLLQNPYRPNPSFYKSHLRPKTLIMPSSLLNAPQPVPKRTSIVPEGFVLGDKPMPAGSRSSILIGGSGGIGGGERLSLSQRTFRGGLEVDGGWVGGAVEEGEWGVGKVEISGNEGDENGDVVGEGYEGEMEDERFTKGRKPGKLYGTSLMDQLEARKAALRGKQRVFTGDSRPSMMARPSLPNHTYQSQPSLQNPTTTTNSTSPPNARAPLIQFDSNGELHAHSPGVGEGKMGDRISKSKSVFGVDQLWEKEMVKLKSIQEREARDREVREAREREEEEKRVKKGKGKGKKDKGKGKALEVEPVQAMAEREEVHLGEQQGEGEENRGRWFGISPVKPISALPPLLKYSPEKGVPTTLPMMTDNIPRQRASSRLGVDGWFGSSDEEEGEDDGAGGDRRKSDKGKGKAKQVTPVEVESSDEEDLPLSRLAPNPNTYSNTVKLVHQGAESSDEEEDVPLSKLATKPSINTNGTNSVLPSIIADSNFGTGSLGLTSTVPEPPALTEEDDDIPLGLRKSAQPKPTATGINEVEDDLPLGYKHAAAATRQMATMSMYSPNPYSGMSWGMGGNMGGTMGINPYMSPNPHMSMMGLGSPGMMAGSPYMMGAGGGVGGVWGSMPNMGVYTQGMGVGMGMGMDHMMGVGQGVNIQVEKEAGRNIDSWRQGIRGDGPSSGSGGSGSKV